MIKNWFKIFVYHTKKNKLFTFLNIFGLSIGMAGLIFAILHWNDEQSYNAWNPEKEKVYEVLAQLSDDEIWANIPAPVGAHLKKSSSKLDKYCYFNTYYFDAFLQYKSKKEYFKKIMSAQSNFFDFYAFEIKKGSKISYENDKNGIALSELSAKRLFGNQNPIGKQIYNGDGPHTVRVVYKVPGKSSLNPDIVINAMELSLIDGQTNWGNFNNGLMLKLKDPKDKAKVENEIMNLFYENVIKIDAKDNGISPEQFIKKYGRTKIYLEQLKTDRLNSRKIGYAEGKGNYQFLLIMMGVSILILVLSIVNYINLSTANAIKRAKEVGVRKTIGASKSNIIQQFIFEAVLTTFFAVILALSIVEITLPFYNEFLEKSLEIKGNLFFIQLIGIFIITVLVAGIFPAIYVANFDILKVIKGNFGRSKSGVWVRNSMLILQFAIAGFFIIGSTIVYDQIKFLKNKELGFHGEQIIEVKYRRKEDVNIYDKYRTIKHEIEKTHGVEQVSSGAFTFGKGANSTSGFTYNDVNIQGHNMVMDYELLDMLKIKIAKGRNINEKISSDTVNAVLINETACNMMKEKNPIGKTIDWNENKLKIIGVVKDFNFIGLQNNIPPMIFCHFKTIDWMEQQLQNISIKISPLNQEQTLSDLEKFWKKNIDQDYPFEYNFVDQQFSQTYKEYVNQSNLFSILNIVVILIALFGLFALTSYSIERRMKEIAIRKTLGAETKSLLFTLTKQYIFFSLIGFGIAVFPVYSLLEIWLQNFAYRIDISIYPFIIGFILLLTLTLVVVLSKAYLATKVNVLKYLKYE